MSLRLSPMIPNRPSRYSPAGGTAPARRSSRKWPKPRAPRNLRARRRARRIGETGFWFWPTNARVFATRICAQRVCRAVCFFFPSGDATTTAGAGDGRPPRLAGTAGTAGTGRSGRTRGGTRGRRSATDATLSAGTRLDRSLDRSHPRPRPRFRFRSRPRRTQTRCRCRCRCRPRARRPRPRRPMRRSPRPARDRACAPPCARRWSGAPRPGAVERARSPRRPRACGSRKARAARRRSSRYLPDERTSYPRLRDRDRSRLARVARRPRRAYCRSFYRRQESRRERGSTLRTTKSSRFRSGRCRFRKGEPDYRTSKTVCR